MKNDLSLLPRSPAEALEPSRAPEPPNRKQKTKMHPALAFLNGLMTLAVVVFMMVAGLFYFAKQQFDRPGPLTHSTVVVIPRGEGVSGIAERLEKQNIISDKRIFVASVLYFKAQKKLKAGEYQIRKKASMRQVLDTITQGKSVFHKLTVPEGLTSLQVIKRMEDHPMLSGILMQMPDEGTLLPDTYKFTRGLSRAELIERMQAEQKKFIDGLWENRADDLPIKTKEEAIILASIVEKETGRADERRRVAGVFINRLKKNMRLQSDPTIIYGLVGGRGRLGRPILRSELNKKTAYNTYHIDGLPPGPIANPGRAAIEAVLNPAPTKDFFFVADGTGGHVFAETLKAHRNNVKNWRKIEKQLRARQAAAKQAAGAENQMSADVQKPSSSVLQPDLTTIPGVQVVSPGEAAAPQIPSFQTITDTAKTADTAVKAPAVPLPIRNPAKQ